MVLSSGSFLLAVSTTASFFTVEGAQDLLSSGVSLIHVYVTVALYFYHSHSFLAASPSLPASAHVTSMIILSM